MPRGPGRNNIPAKDRWEAKIQKVENGCWEWTGSRNNRGYGTFAAESHKSVMAHRFGYELLVGPIPEGLTLDHLCRNRACVNPAHLEAVPHGVNLMRGNTVNRLGRKAKPAWRS